MDIGRLAQQLSYRDRTLIYCHPPIEI